ncbi:adhesion G-protein coupled receptor G6-like [Octopus vulgaris]|uniref:Adhesion G-protein coupled receptor G6-like n=1 Tax=Octopus vulgaris TaxID=6645 RepID=A0AA36C0U1_OCTVU|nr:adhesion G-protein coupled receptor G6-like [Octopus vulgaris]
MEDELSSLTGAYEVEYCGLRGQKEIFSINCSVPDDVTKDEVLKQIFETFNTSQSLRNFGISEDKMGLIGEMVCNENTTSTNSRTFYWPMTKVGTNVTIPCDANTAKRYCSAVEQEMRKCSPFTGIWQEPDVSQCYTTRWTNSFLYHLIYNSTFKNIIKDTKTAENVSRAMDYELLNLTGECEVEHCGLKGEKEIFSINCSVPGNVTKDEVLKQIFEIFNTSQSFLNLGIQKDKIELIGEMVCNENTTSTNSRSSYWPMTKVGTNVTIPCDANTAKRYCSAVEQEMRKCSPFTGIWQEPDMSRCYISGGITENPNNTTRWTNSFLFHVIYNSTVKNIEVDINTAENMEHELLNLTGAFEVEYCGLQIFSINCSVPDEITKEQALKQILRTFNTSQTLRNLGIQLRNVKLIDEMFCKESTTSTSNGTFYWPITKIGTDVTIPCHANVATRHCSSGNVAKLEMPTNQYGTSPKCSPLTGVWQEPDMSQCYKTEGITQQLKNITIVDIDKENVEEVLTILSDISKKAVYFKAEDIDLAVDIQEKILPLISNVSADITLTNILLSVNNMIDTPEEILVEAEQSDGTGSRMLDIIEAIPEEIPLEEQQLTALYSNLGIGAIKVEKDTFNGAVYGISFGNKENEAKTMIYNNSDSYLQVNDNVDFISLPTSLSKHLKAEDQSAVSRITFFSMQDDKLYRVTQNSSTKANTMINSNIIAANIPNIKVTNLDEPVNISFNLIDQNATNPQCVFWDESPGQIPKWSTKGCNIAKYEPGQKALCSCDHLTSFALLMNVYQKPVVNIHPLSMTSYIGCGISFVCLILTIIIHVCSKNVWKSMASKILVNLCVSLAITNLIFLVGMQPYASKITAACKVLAQVMEQQKRTHK